MKKLTKTLCWVILRKMKLRRITKRIFTASLAVWLSGIVLILCCNMPTAKAETISCPLARKDNCAKSSENDFRESFRNESLTFDCCGFPAKVFDKVRKLEFQPQAAEAVETVRIAAPKISFSKTVVKKDRVYQSFVHDRANAHLRNCVFRI